MSLIVECDICAKNYKVADDKAGKKINCPNCGAVISVPLPVAFELPPKKEAAPRKPASPQLPYMPPRIDGVGEGVAKRSEPEEVKVAWGRIVKLIFAGIGVITVLSCCGGFIHIYNSIPSSRVTPPSVDSVVGPGPNWPGRPPWDAPAPVASPPPATAVWTKHVDKAGWFEAEFPSAPTVEVKPDEKEVSASIPGKDDLFHVNFKKVDDPPAGPEERMNMSKYVRDEVLKATKATLVNSQEITVAGRPALQYEYAKQFQGKNYISTVRYVWENDRHFSIGVIRDTNHDVTGEMNRFFNSFRILSDAERSP